MLKTFVVRLVQISARLSWAVAALGIVLAIYCAAYAAHNFSVTTDVNSLFPTNLPWTQRTRQYLEEFPQYDILAIVDAPTPELSQLASARLASALGTDRQHIRDVEEPQAGQFFAQNGLLFLPTGELARTVRSLRESAPLIGTLAEDPSLRGILHVFSRALAGASLHATSLNSLAPTMNAASDALSDALNDRPSHFSWRVLAAGSNDGGTRNFIEIAPVLDFKSLQPGRGATDAINRAVERLNLGGEDQARVRLTGLVPLNDAQFATLKENAALNIAVSVGAVLVILWLALRSWKLVAAAVISVFCGLCYTAALALNLVHSLNLISVAFFVLFVGLAVDFAIQFGVRYRAERHEKDELRPALASAARKAGGPLMLAAAATALGFSAFLPTDYRGLSELGRIAGPGMLIAFLTSVTLLPALIAILRPPKEPRAMGFAGLAPLDRFLQRRRMVVLIATIGAVLLASPLLLGLKFDFNTLHLQNPNAPAVAAFLDVRRDPTAGVNAAEVVLPDLRSADAVAERLAALPEVASAKTLSNFVPTDQAEKLRLVHELAIAIGPALAPAVERTPPTDREIVTTLEATARQLSKVRSDGTIGSRAAKRLSGFLSGLASANAAARVRASKAFVVPLILSLTGLQVALHPQPVKIGDIPEDVARSWVTPAGRARVEVLPRADPDSTASLQTFVRAILAVRPDATGPAVTLYEAGNTIMRAFIEAGVFALIAIAILLWLALRRARDVLLTLIPLLLAALLTLELCAYFNIPLNFTNIIAFPLLLGVGVAFKIYYIMAWRRGRTALVQSTLTRAVIFSAMTTATAFGSLWLSRHPGTSSMGELMLLSLVCTMLAAVLFQPVLMGPPREEAPNMGDEHGHTA